MCLVTFSCRFVLFSLLAPMSQSCEKDICSCYFCLCSPRLGAAGETHLNANVLLFLPAKGQVNELVSKQKNRTLGPRCDINGSTPRKGNILTTESAAGKMVKLICKQTDTKKLRYSIMLCNSGLLKSFLKKKRSNKWFV